MRVREREEGAASGHKNEGFVLIESLKSCFEHILDGFVLVLSRKILGALVMAAILMVSCGLSCL